MFKCMKEEATLALIHDEEVLKLVDQTPLNGLVN